MLSIKGTSWFPEGKRVREVNIRVDFLDAREDSGANAPNIDPPILSGRERLIREVFERFGLTAQFLDCRAIRIPHCAMSRKD